MQCIRQTRIVCVDSMNGYIGGPKKLNPDWSSVEHGSIKFLAINY